MAVIAELFHDSGFVAIDLEQSKDREIVADDPAVPGFTLPRWAWFYWDAEKLERGEREFAGLEILDIGRLDDTDLTGIERLGLPHVDCPEAGLYDATVADVLRWAKGAYAGRAEAGRKAGAA